MTRAGSGFCLGAVLLVSSGASDRSIAAPPDSPGRQAVPADTLSAGCAGGVTGGGAGVAITGAGRLLRWSHSGPATAGMTWTSEGRDSTLARRLFSRLATVRFDATDFHQPSNVTCFLQRRNGSRSHEVAWPMGQRPRRIIAIVALYDDLTRALDRR